MSGWRGRRAVGTSLSCVLRTVLACWRPQQVRPLAREGSWRRRLVNGLTRANLVVRCACGAHRCLPAPPPPPPAPPLVRAAAWLQARPAHCMAHFEHGFACIGVGGGGRRL